MLSCWRIHDGPGLPCCTQLSTLCVYAFFNAVAAAASGGVQQMTVQELQHLLTDDAKAEGVQFVDVREPNEYEIASLPRFQLYPLSQASRWGTRVKEVVGFNMSIFSNCARMVNRKHLGWFKYGIPYHTHAPRCAHIRVCCILLSLYLAYHPASLYPTDALQRSWADTIADDLDIAKPTVVLCHHGMR